MQAIFLIILLVFLLYALFRGRTLAGIIQHMKTWLIWALIFALLIVGYAYRHEMDGFKQRVLGVLIPSYQWTEEGEIILSRHADSHFYVKATVNDGATIKFLIDTGATSVALSRSDARKMGFNLNKLEYTQKSSTASGTAYSAPVKIKKLVIGNKVIYNVRAHVSSGGLDVSLLGMSVIDDFSDFRFTKDSLILKY